MCKGKDPIGVCRLLLTGILGLGGFAIPGESWLSTTKQLLLILAASGVSVEVSGFCFGISTRSITFLSSGQQAPPISWPWCCPLALCNFASVLPPAQPTFSYVIPRAPSRDLVVASPGSSPSSPILPLRTLSSHITGGNGVTMRGNT